jgi:hypothetical protein
MRSIPPLFLALLLAACSGGQSQPPAVSTPQQQTIQSAPPPAMRALEASSRPNQVRAEIARWFTTAGYHSSQVEALVEHARIESGFRPCATNGAGFRYIFQWSGTRLRRLHQFANSHACPPLDKQLAFADHELRNEPAFSCFRHATTRSSASAALRRGFGRGSC